jgi:hypothetical protein
LTHAEKQRAIEASAAGATYDDILRVLDISSLALFGETTCDADFARELQRARHNALEIRSDGLLTISDDASTLLDIQAARLKSENLRWLLSKRMPRQYGDQLALTVDQGPDLKRALARAESVMVAGTPARQELEEELEQAVTRLF